MTYHTSPATKRGRYSFMLLFARWWAQPASITHLCGKAHGKSILNGLHGWYCKGQTDSTADAGKLCI